MLQQLTEFIGLRRTTTPRAEEGIMNEERQPNASVFETDASTLPSEKTRTTRTVTLPFTTERNFLRYPFFWLSNNKADRIELYERIERDGEHAEISWKVVRGLDNELPSRLARKIHRLVVEPIINRMPRPVSSVIRLASLREIGRIVGEGNTDRIKKALEDIVLAGVQSKGTFYLKNRESYIDETFHLYDGVIFAGQKLPDGRVADAVYVVLSRWFLENINDGYTVPLNWDYHRSLQGEIVSRMYELLSLDFFIAFEQGREYVDKIYTQWCPYFPIVPQDKLFKVKGQLKSAIYQHMESGYLGKYPTFTPIPGRQADWTIRFYTGERAIAEYQQAKRQKFTPRRQARRLQAPEPRPLDLPGIGQTSFHPQASQNAGDLSPEQADYITWLESQGVKDAKRLFASSPWKDDPDTLEFIKQDFLIHCKEEQAGGFEFKKGRRAWLSWALSSPKYYPSEKLEKKIEQRKRQETERQRVAEEQRLAPLREEYDRYVASEIARYRDANPADWQRLFEEGSKKAAEENPYVRRLLENNPRAMDRPTNRRPIEAERNRRVKEILSLPAFGDWLKSRAG
jgi:hypothetical protein